MSSELTDSSDHKPVSAEFVVSTRGGAADILVTRGVLNDWRKAYKTNGTEGRYKLRGANYMKLVISDLKVLSFLGNFVLLLYLLHVFEGGEFV